MILHRTTKSLQLIKNEKSKHSVSASRIPKNPPLQNKLTLSDNLRSFLLKSRDSKRASREENYKGSIGVSAKIDFYESYRKLPEITERIHYKKTKESPNVAYLQEISKSRIRPHPFGVVRNKGSESCINLKGSSMGDNFAGALSKCLTHFNQIEILNLKNNRLTENGVLNILSNLLFTNLRELDLTENKLGNKSIDFLADILAQSDSVLQVLHLESIRVKEYHFVKLLQALSDNNTLQYLNISKNSLSYKVALALKETLKSNNSLVKVDLHWNKFTGFSGLLIFQGLEVNTSILELDLSWNSLGGSLEITSSLSKSVGVMQGLLHLDLSYNNFNVQEATVIGEGLLNNHILLGLHMQGNNCELDGNGFIISKVNNNLLGTVLPFQRIFHSKKCGENCWICEGWVECSIKIQYHEASPLFIHLDMDNYTPYLLQQQNDYFSITRALPPNKEVKFFFSSAFSVIISHIYSTTQLNPPHHIDKPKDCFISIVNTYTPRGLELDLFSPFATKPRIKDIYMSQNGEERITWSFENSVFKDYVFDSASLMNDCFEFDWHLSRIESMVKNLKDKKKTKKYLRGVYEHLRLCYKAMSSLSGNEIFSIGSNILTDFLYQCKIIDNLYQLRDLGVNWNSANVPLVKNQLFNPGNALVRYEFMEIIVRIAQDRFVRTGICKKINKSVRKLFEEHILPNTITYKLNDISSYNSNAWRNEVYICEDVDIILKVYKPILDCAFLKYSGRKTLPGCKKFMCVEEFSDLCKDSGLANEDISSREIYYCFVQSMMTQVDEYFKKRHFEMNYIEFLEAITRVIDLRDSNLNRALHMKLEQDLRNIMRLCPKYLIESFTIPDENTFYRMKYRVIQGLSF